MIARTFHKLIKIQPISSHIKTYLVSLVENFSMFIHWNRHDYMDMDSLITAMEAVGFHHVRHDPIEYDSS